MLTIYRQKRWQKLWRVLKWPFASAEEPEQIHVQMQICRELSVGVRGP